MFIPVEKRKLLSNVVESQIEDSIRKKMFVPGEKLPSE